MAIEIFRLNDDTINTKSDTTFSQSAMATEVIFWGLLPRFFHQGAVTEPFDYVRFLPTVF